MTSAYPAPVETLLPQARTLAAKLGEIPSRNKLMTEFRIGAKKATQLRSALTETSTITSVGRGRSAGAALHAVPDSTGPGQQRALSDPDGGLASVTASDQANVDGHLAASRPPTGAADRAVAEAAAGLPVDGYTDRVRELEAAAAEADRVRALPTARVLARRQEVAEAEALAALDTAQHARRLAAASERERADLAARAASAAAKRHLEADVDVRALALSRRRRRWTAIAWTVLLLAMSFTAVNVQRFAAAGAPAGSASWLVAWGVDPLLSLLVVGLLLSGGDLAVLGLPISTGPGRRVIRVVEFGALGAVLMMNTAPALPPILPADQVVWQTVCLHIIVPLAGMAAAWVLPVIQQRYAMAITSLHGEVSR